MNEFRAVTYAEFLDVLGEQGITLKQSIKNDHTRASSKRTPSGILLAISQACERLNARPDLPLIDCSPEGIKPPDSWRNDTPATVLTHLLNCSAAANREPGIESLPAAFIGTCAQADDSFANTYMEMAEGNLEHPPQIFVDHTNVPVLLQKNPHFGKPTQLGLRPVTINGVEYPEGTIFIARPPQPQSPDPDLRIRPIGEIGSIGAARLSVFALRPEEREPFLYGRSEFGQLAAVKRAMGAVTIADFRVMCRELTATALSRVTCVI